MATDPPGVGHAESSDAALFDQIERLPRWFSVAALKPVMDINSRLLKMMADAPPPLPTPLEISDVLRSLDAPVLERIARCPCLLVDAGFQDDRRWKTARRVAARTAAPSTVSPDAARLLVPLARATFFVAWHYARCYPQPAELVIGINAETARVLSEIPLEELDRIAETHSQWIQPRWADRTDTWERLIAASSTQARPFTADLRGLQLILGDLLGTDV